MEKRRYPLLDTITAPCHVKALSADDLNTLCDEVRAFIIETVAKTGGHLGASLGVVELTVALYKVFSPPKDTIVWDVGHQSYPHKVLTGRRDRLHTLRQGGGLSGFAKRSESIYDSFGAGHSSTAISAALGMTVGRYFQGQRDAVVAIVGDGAMSAGLAFEGLNNMGHLQRRSIVILNDNHMSIAASVGAFRNYLSKLLSSSSFLKARNLTKAVTGRLHQTLPKMLARFEDCTKAMIVGGTFFEELGFYYLGPIDGHKLDHLLPVLENVHKMQENRPVLVHVRTQKGKGYAPAERSTEKYHGVKKFCIKTGEQQKNKGDTVSYTHVFATSLTAHADKDSSIVAITAAMPSGTGLSLFAQRHPERTFDVAIAEQHAVTFAAGLACEGMKPFVAIYSTFLQRAFDQIIHDVCVQKIAVRFAIDRAGLVGPDGATHAGMFDIMYLVNIPNIIVMAPSHIGELARMVATAVACDDTPIAFRYPKREAINANWQSIAEPLSIGRARFVERGDRVAILSYGGRLQTVLQATEVLRQRYTITPTVVDARFAKPLDTDLLLSVFRTHRSIVTIEEGVTGGFGSTVLHMACRFDVLHKVKLCTLTLPDVFLDHDTVDRQYETAKLQAKHIVSTVLKMESIREQ